MTAPPIDSPATVASVPAAADGLVAAAPYATSIDKPGSASAFNEEPPAERSPVALSTARLIGIAATVTCTMCLGGANAMALLIALPAIQSELDLNETDLQWVVAVYSLTAGCFLMLSGRLADIYGRKLMFVLGAVWLAVWTLVGGFMNKGVGLIMTRALAGCGNAMSTPSAIGVIAALFTGRARSYAFAAFAAGAPVGGGIGLVLGGVLTAYTRQTWRTVLWILGALAFAVAVAAYFLVPGPKYTGEKKIVDKRIDWIGAFLVTAGLIALMFGISDGPSAPQEFATSYIIAMLVLGIVLLVAFFLWERHITRSESIPPLIRLHLFKEAGGKLAAVYFIGFVSWMGFSALMYHATLFYQQVQGTGPIGAMLRFLPTAVSGILCNVVVASVVDKFRTQWIICLGITCTAVANILLANAPKDGSYWAMPFNSMWLGVVGADFLMATGSIFVAAFALPEEQSVAGAVSQTLNRLGGAFGVSLTSVIASSFNSKSLQAGVSPVDSNLNGIHSASWLAAGFSLAALVIAVVMLRGLGIITKEKKQPPPPSPIPDHEKGSEIGSSKA